MKQIYFRILIVIAIMTIGQESLWAQKRGNIKFMAGAEFQFEYLNTVDKASPKTPDTILAKLIFYKTCASQWLDGGFNGKNTQCDVVYFSQKCCEYLLDTFYFDEALSNANITPYCPYGIGTSETTCEKQNSSNPGYKTEVYVDTIILYCEADDWVFGYLYCSANERSNYYPFNSQYHPDGLGSMQTQITTAAPPPYPFPVNPCVCRIQGTNTFDQGVSAAEGTFYIEAVYSNDLDNGYYPGTTIRRTKGNTTPTSAVNPLIFQCVDKLRDYDLGYKDPDGHFLRFEPSEPFKDINFNQGFNRNPVPILFAAPATYTNPIGVPGSIYSLNGETGVLTFYAPPNAKGTYKTAIKIQEFLRNPKDFPGDPPIGTTYRDIALTILDIPGCQDNNLVGNNSQFIPNSLGNLVNCDTALGRENTIESCAGNDISFDIKAVSFSTYNGASIVISADVHPVIASSSNSLSSSYINYPSSGGFDTATATFTWNIPDTVPPGDYYVTFQIRDCISPYILSKSQVVTIRVNDKTSISVDYTGFDQVNSNQFITIPEDRRAYNCDGYLGMILSGHTGEDDAIFTWRSLDPDVIITPIPPTNSSIPTILDNTPGKEYLVEVTSNQYCKNRDTIQIVNKTPIAAAKDSVILRDSCFNTEGQIRIVGLPDSNNILFDWQAQNSFFTSKPSALSSKGDILLQQPFNVYNIFVIMPDTCIKPISVSIPLQGIKPRVELVTDKEYVCPFDTIQVNTTKMTTSICGQSSFSIATGPTKYAEYPGTASNTNPTPKIFTTTPEINYTRTQMLFRAEELVKQGFKPGLISAISFNIDYIANPRAYNNVVLKVKCTDRIDMQNLIFENTDDMITLAQIPTLNLANGWNTIPFASNFTWDGETNLIFEIWSTCNLVGVGIVPVPPAYQDHLTNYISVIGQYGKGQIGFSKSVVEGSNYRHNIKFDYKDLANNIQFAWSDLTNPPDLSTLSSATDSTPKISSEIPRDYLVVYNNGACKDSTSVKALIDTNYKIDLDRNYGFKCPGDTIALNATKGYISKRDMKLVCGLDNLIGDSCRLYDSKISPYFGDPDTKVGTGLHTPFGGGGSGAGSATTDRRIQFIIPYDEIKNDPNNKPGYINSLSFYVTQLFANTNPLYNFTIKIKCIPDTMRRLYSNNFESAASFEEVFNATTYTPLPGKNDFMFNKKYAWAGNSGLMIDVCFDNDVDVSYFSSLVNATNMTDTVLRYKASNNGDDFGCSYTTGALSPIRPDVSFDMCIPKYPDPPIPTGVKWAPTTFISNTQITDPVIYNENTTTYYVILNYIDTTYGRNKIVCSVRDTFLSEVTRPIIEFTPNEPVACLGSSGVVAAGVVDSNDNYYKYTWYSNQAGLDPNQVNNKKQNVVPPNAGYYYVKVNDLRNPNCYNTDSVYFDIQLPRVMPDLGPPALICEGDTALLSINTEIGYKNPSWEKDGSFIDSGYTYPATEPGVYQVFVDSGVCRNMSTQVQVIMRTVDSIELNLDSVTICEGDTALLYYNNTLGLANPIWNNGSTDKIIKVTQPGIYFIVNPKDENGCNMVVLDTALVSITDNLDFSLQGDTLCMSANEHVILQPDPYDPTATYTWYPDNTQGPTFTASRPGLYQVTRKIGSCEKTAQAFIINDTIGIIDLGKDKVICCDEVIALDANPENAKQYVRYLWSNTENNQIVYTLPNTSGKYIVEAFKANGCRDTGSIYIENLCTHVSASVERDQIHLGETNQIIGEHDIVNSSNIIYEWIPSSDRDNEIINGDSLNAIAKPADTGDIEYVLVMKVIDSSLMPPKPFCIENAVVRFKVIPNNITLPDWFSPNQDGDHDMFFPDITGNVNITEFMVYNRFGQKLHDEVKPWDGKFQGEPQPVGVYVGLITYEVLEPKQPVQVKHKQISITLIR